MNKLYKWVKQFLSLHQRKAPGMSHLKSRLLPGARGSPGLQTCWCSQHFLWDIRTAVGSWSELWEIQLRFFIPFSKYVPRCSLLCGSCNVSGPAERVTCSEMGQSLGRMCLMAVGKSYSLGLLMSSQAYLEGIFHNKNQILEMKKCVFKETFFCTDTITWEDQLESLDSEFTEL